MSFGPSPLVRASLAWGALSLAGLVFAAPAPAKACGGTFCDGTVANPMPVNQTGENILFEVRDGYVEAQVQIQYNGDPAQFGWLVPVMAEPEVRVGSEMLMQLALTSTTPVYTLNQSFISCRDDGGGAPITSCGEPLRNLSAANGGGLGTDGSFGEDDAGGEPDVVSRGSAGAFEYVVLSGGTIDGVVDWLDQHSFVPDDEATPIVESYMDEGFLLLAIKLNPNAGADEIHPLAFRYAGDEPCIPIRLTRIAAEQDMGIRAFFLGDERTVPTNFKHVELNEFQIGLLNGTGVDNYEEVVTLAVDEAGGEAFVTEYAGTSEVIPTWPLADYVFSTALVGETPALAIRSLQDDGLMQCDLDDSACLYAHPQLQGIVNRYVPVPDGFTERDFYLDIDAYPDLIDEVAWDAQLFADTLQERIVDPAQHAMDILERSPYLTRMFTTMSPHEMVEDPLFAQNSAMPEVSNLHQATRTFACRGRDFLTLDDGTEVTLEEDGSLPEAIANTPFAARVETCLPSGPPTIDQDFMADEIAPAVEKVLAEHPVRRGRDDGDEGCAVAARRSGLVSLLGLGLLLGFRRPRRRR